MAASHRIDKKEDLFEQISEERIGHWYVEKALS
jgi:hypothetical protein